MKKLKIFYTFVIILVSFLSKIAYMQDITLSMYMYLANHLTPEECLRLVAYLYAEGLEFTAVKELEQNLPIDESCLSLMMTWNNSDGKEKSFLTVSDGLRKIGRDKLCEWLSDTVFTQLSMELNHCFLQNTTQITNNLVTAVPRSRKMYSKFKIDRCTSEKSFLFLLFDTICMYFILMTIAVLVFYLLCLFVRAVKSSQKILGVKENVYKILELGILPQDLELEDEILTPFF